MIRLMPTITDLPPPPPGRHGWPWTVATPPAAPVMANNRPWPRITIVTPSYQQAQYLEEAIRSVLLQGYPNLEYIVMDGGSRDGSVEIIQRYAPWLSYWQSQPDGGQSAALADGFPALPARFWHGSTLMIVCSREHCSALANFLRIDRGWHLPMAMCILLTLIAG